MAVSVSVALLSGQCVSLEVSAETILASVRLMAQAKMGRTLVALLTPSGMQLNLFSSVAQSGLEDGVVLSAVAQAGPKLRSHRRASTFVAILADGSVVTWGHRFHGGDSNSVRNQLFNVHDVYSTNKALAAVRADGSVVAWGHADHGGDSSAVQDQLQTVEQVFASMQAFAALRSDGRVVTWGHATHGGDSRCVAAQLVDVREIFSTEAAFVAVRGDRSVVTWGHEEQGGDSSTIVDELVNIRSIAASGKAFAAVRYDGRVISWGHPEYGGDSSAMQDRFGLILVPKTIRVSIRDVALPWHEVMRGGVCEDYCCRAPPLLLMPTPLPSLLLMMT